LSSEQQKTELRDNQFKFDDNAIVTVDISYDNKQLRGWTYQLQGGKTVSSDVVKDVNPLLYANIQASATTFVAAYEQGQKEKQRLAELETKRKAAEELQAFKDKLTAAAPKLFEHIHQWSTYTKEVSFYADDQKKDGVDLSETTTYPSRQRGRWRLSPEDKAKIVYLVERGSKTTSRFTKLEHAVAKVEELLNTTAKGHTTAQQQLEACTQFAIDAGMKLYKGYKAYGSGRDRQYWDEWKLLMPTAEGDHNSAVVIDLTIDSDFKVHGYHVRIDKTLRWMGRYIATKTEISVRLETAGDVKHFIADVVKSFLPETETK